MLEYQTRYMIRYYSLAVGKNANLHILLHAHTLSEETLKKELKLEDNILNLVIVKMEEKVKLLSK